jgi:DNA-directed RNA polymerase specialized sigma24 family protein
VVGSDGEAAGKRPAADDDAASIQPDCWDEESELGKPVRATAILDNINPELGEEARRRQESLQRRLADQTLLQVLASDSFAGLRYDRFVSELAAYGISVLRGWMHSGYMFKLTAARGRNLHPTEWELERLARDSDVREELATMTVALALPGFRTRALIGGGWRVDGGASVPTYFMGACVHGFPNEFRKWSNYEQRHDHAARQEGTLYPPVTEPALDPAVIAIGNIRVLDDLNGLDERTAAVVALTIDGYSQDEIAELLDLPSVRAVEGILYRWRDKAKHAMRRGGERDGR